MSSFYLLEFPASATIMIKDKIRSDVGGVLDMGLQSVLVEVGIFRIGGWLAIAQLVSCIGGSAGRD